jgi:4-carboxymuconolactone decarboxylase
MMNSASNPEIQPRRHPARSGFTADDFKEILLKRAIYCGVSAANRAVKEASAIIGEPGLLNG